MAGFTRKNMRPRLITLSGAAVIALALAAPSQGATLPTGFAETQVATGLAAPTAMSFSPDGRLFVTEQGGRLRVIKNGALLATPFLTVNVNAVGERGLLGVAFDPNFAFNQFVYVYYTTASATIHNRVSRFTAMGDASWPSAEVAPWEQVPGAAVAAAGGVPVAARSMGADVVASERPQIVGSSDAHPDVQRRSRARAAPPSSSSAPHYGRRRHAASRG